MLFLSEADVRNLLPMARVIDLLREGFDAYASDRAQNQPRRRLILPSGASLHSMAGAYGSYFGTKIYSNHPKHNTWFLFVLYDAETARPLSLFEANILGQIRTGAASGLAADLLAPAQADTVALIGSGLQARSQLDAMRVVRPVRKVRIWSRGAESRERFAAECAAAGVEAHVASSAADAVAGAQIVVTATFAKDPVLESEAITAGTFIAAMGSNHPQRRELPAELIQRASLLVADSIEQARIEAGDFLLALDGDGWRRVVELRSIVSTPDRYAHCVDGITIFKSVGLGLEDVIAAGFVYEEAKRLGMGSELPILIPEPKSESRYPATR